MAWFLMCGERVSDMWAVVHSWKSLWHQEGEIAFMIALILFTLLHDTDKLHDAALINPTHFRQECERSLAKCPAWPQWLALFDASITQTTPRQLLLISIQFLITLTFPQIFLYFFMATLVFTPASSLYFLLLQFGTFLKVTANVYLYTVLGTIFAIPQGCLSLFLMATLELDILSCASVSFTFI